VSRTEARVGLNGMAELNQGFWQGTNLAQRDTEVIAGLGVIRTDRKRFTKLADGLLGISVSQIAEPELRMPGILNAKR
jgi:hypothetical protein